MNQHEFENFTTRKSGVITANDLVDKADRTLLYGYTCSRDTFHVYLKNGEIETVVYGYNQSPDVYEVHSNHDYVPNKRVYPEDCDVEFAKLLRECGVEIAFTHYSANRYIRLQNEAKQYSGSTL